MVPTLPFASGQLVKLTAAVASAAYTFPDPQQGGAQVLIYVQGSVPVVFCPGAAAVVPNSDPATATNGAFVVAPGTTQAFTIGEVTQLAYIRDGGSDSVFYLMYGYGS